MEKFNKYKHVHLITKWWLEDSELSALLKKDKGYKLPSEWIQDLEKSDAYIFNNGIGEIRDILLGKKGRESEIFYYSPDKKSEAYIAGRMIGWCFSNEIKTIRTKHLEVREQVVTEASIQGLTSLVNKGVDNERVYNKDTDLPDTIGTTYTGSTAEDLPNGNATSGTASVSTSSSASKTATSSTANTASTTTASKKPAGNNIRTKKCNTSRKKKQSEGIKEA